MTLSLLPRKIWPMTSVPIAIVAALDDEIRVIRSKMDVDSRVHIRPSLIETGKYLDQPLLLMRSGLGIGAMEASIAYCLDNYHPGFCLHIGYCGGADPKHQAGDLIVATHVVDTRDGTRHEMDKSIVTQALHVCRDAGLRAKDGGIATVEKVISSPHEKAFIGTQHSADAIDMESCVLVSACEKRGIPCLVVRGVLDPLDVVLPDMGDVVDEEGKTGGMALTSHLIKKPKDILKLPKIEYLATQARGAITAFADAWLKGSV